MNTHKLDRWSFWWSEARLVVAALALLLGGVPPLTLLKLPSELTGNLLTIGWAVSGLAALYMFYRWNMSGNRVFGGKENRDMLAFFVSVISGVNLGLVALLGRNIGMNAASGQMVFIVTALVYLACAWHLYFRFKAHGDKIF